MKYEDLRILDELREKGSITEEEYQREKEKILNAPIGSYSKTSAKPLFGMAENTYLMLMHISQFAGIVIPFAGFVVPILMWLVNKDNNSAVDLHGKQIINVIISYTIYTIVLFITILGIPFAIILGILYVIFVIVASVRANNGEFYKYPFTIKFVQ